MVYVIYNSGNIYITKIDVTTVYDTEGLQRFTKIRSFLDDQEFLEVFKFEYYLSDTEIEHLQLSLFGARAAYYQIAFPKGDKMHITLVDAL